MMDVLAIAWLAFLFDCLAGDPRSRLHPVIWIGTAISFLERLLRREQDSPCKKIISGGILVVCLLVMVYSLVWGLLLLLAADGMPRTAGILIEALLLYVTISPRSLAEAGREIHQYLLAGDLPNARFKVGWIVGRDTENLSVPEITRATVETIAENIVDGIISPLFFFFLGGVPLAMVYRAANTMDSMIGYKNEKYLYFGRIAARLDDVLNYIPARLTGGLLVVVAFFLHFDYQNAWRMLRRDAGKHPSPNGGYTEATTAGALGIRLGGLNYYFGRPSFRAHMGDALQELAPHHIKQAIRLLYGTTLAFLVLCSCLLIGGGFLF